jgi:glucose/arabinose dehydrogenase
MRRDHPGVRDALLFGPLLVFASAACHDQGPSYSGLPDASVGPDGGADAPAGADARSDGDAAVSFVDADQDASIAHPCTLPGSIQYTTGGVVVVPGGTAGPDLSYLTVPTGFCVHYYGTVANTRQLRFAPGGELFVASPSTATTGGGLNGLSVIAVLPDDDHDGVADSVLTYLGGLPSTQGLLFAGGFLYYQDSTKIMRVPYALGDRSPSGSSLESADVQIYVSVGHWPKTLDIADDGTIYVGNGGDQTDTCDPTRPFHGGVLKLDGSPGGSPVAKGFRNPIAIRCAHGHDQCFALELAKDSSMAPDFGREKMAPIRQGDDWGFPCCATANTPYQGVTPVPDCSGVITEAEGLYIGDTPFGLDFEPGVWPAPWTGDAFVTLHGAYSTWKGSRLLAVQMDPTTGLPVPGSDLSGVDTGGMTTFATGWDDGKRDHGRPAALAFSKDGRLFLGNDNDGSIVWIAPLSL